MLAIDNGLTISNTVCVALVGGIIDQLSEKSQFQKASHLPFSLRSRVRGDTVPEPATLLYGDTAVLLCLGCALRQRQPELAV